MQQSQRGFTLIELLTIIGIIGVVSALGITTFAVYRKNAAYASSDKTLRDAITAFEAGINQPDKVLPAVGSFMQNSQGAISGGAAAEMLPAMMLPPKLKFQFSFDPSCNDGSCQMASFQANHCFADEHLRILRFGDGLDVRLEHIAGGGCS